MYECETWTIKMAEHWRTDASELWFWRRPLKVPWTARRSSNQSVLKEINPEYSLEGLMWKLKLQNFGHLMWRANSLEKILMLGKTEGRRRSRWQRMKWLNSITYTLDMSLSKLQDIVKDREAWRTAVHGVTKSWTLLRYWTMTITCYAFSTSVPWDLCPKFSFAVKAFLLSYCLSQHLIYFLHSTHNNLWWFFLSIYSYTGYLIQQNEQSRMARARSYSLECI